MSRLECLQAAIDWHVARLMVEHPNKRVSVVLFSSEVTLCGDCTGEPKSTRARIVCVCVCLCWRRVCVCVCVCLTTVACSPRGRQVERL